MILVAFYTFKCNNKNNEKKMAIIVNESTYQTVI